MLRELAYCCLRILQVVDMTLRSRVGVNLNAMSEDRVQTLPPSRRSGLDLFFLMSLILLNIGFTEVVPTVVGERGLISNRYTCHHQNDFRIKMGSDVSRFNVSLIVQSGTSLGSTGK